MSDIFISYAKEDREWVIALADALREQGWTVWWDRSIPFGQSFQDVIEKQLSESQCAIVVWSRHSVDSGWVSAEADEARNRNILVPVVIDDVAPPLVFRQLQTADLKDWDNDPASPVFKKLVADIATLLGQPILQTPSGFSQPVLPEPVPVQKTSHKWLWVAGLAGLIAMGTLWFSNLQKADPVPAPVIEEFRVENAHITTGETSSLIWRTSNASSVEIRELGEVANNGSSRIRPEKTRFYTLIAKNKEGQTVQQTVEVIVEEPAEKTPDPGSLISLFNESFEEGNLDLAEKFLIKATTMAPDHPKVLKIKDRLVEERQVQKLAEEKKLKEQQRAEQERERQEAEARALKQKQEEKRIAEEMRIAAEKQLQQEEQEKARLIEIQKQEEAKQKKNEELQRKQQEQKLAEQQRIKEDRLRKKAEQQRLAEIEKQKQLEAERLKKEQENKIAADKQRVEEEKQRQHELEKQQALATPAPIAIDVIGIDKKFKRYGLEATTLKKSVSQQLQTAGFNVVSLAEAKNNKDSVVMQLRYKYIERNYGAGELITYSATIYLFPASSTKGEALWKQRIESMANTLELGKVNKEFARNVEKFIQDHPKKGLEFKK